MIQKQDLTAFDLFNCNT